MLMVDDFQARARWFTFLLASVQHDVRGGRLMQYPFLQYNEHNYLRYVRDTIFV